jgi:predicted DNA-binding transcriptional regulator AlpA
MSHKKKLIRLPAVQNLSGMKRQSIYNRIATGEFPPPVKYDRFAFWPENEIVEVVNCITAGGDLRELVKAQLKARKEFTSPYAA